MKRPLKALLITLGDPNQLSGGYLYHQRMARLAPVNNASLEFVSVPRLPFPLSLAFSPGSMRAARRSRPDVLVVDSIVTSSLIRLPRGASAVPLVASIHQRPGGTSSVGPTHQIQTKLDLRAYRACHSLIVASQSLGQEILKSGLAPERLIVVPPGRDVSETWAQAPIDLRKGRSTAVLCVANWLPAKGVQCLLEAASQLSDETATIHLAGRTDVNPAYSRSLRRFIKLRRLEDRVVIHGPLSLEGVARLYANADIFVLPSFQEAFGTAFGEAMSFGLPVVGWDTGNLPFLARQGEDGLVLPVGDIDALASAIRELAGNGELRTRLGKSGKARALTRPTWSDSAKSFFEVLRGSAEEAQAE